MYVKTEDLELVNLEHYPRIAIYPDKAFFYFVLLLIQFQTPSLTKVSLLPRLTKTMKHALPLTHSI